MTFDLDLLHPVYQLSWDWRSRLPVKVRAGLTSKRCWWNLEPQSQRFVWLWKFRDHFSRRRRCGGPGNGQLSTFVVYCCLHALSARSINTAITGERNTADTVTWTRLITCELFTVAKVQDTDRPESADGRLPAVISVSCPRVRAHYTIAISDWMPYRSLYCRLGTSRSPPSWRFKQEMRECHLCWMVGRQHRLIPCERLKRWRWFRAAILHLLWTVMVKAHGRGHLAKLSKRRCQKDVRKYFSFTSCNQLLKCFGRGDCFIQQH